MIWTAFREVNHYVLQPDSILTRSVITHSNCLRSERLLVEYERIGYDAYLIWAEPGRASAEIRRAHPLFVGAFRTARTAVHLVT